MGRSQESFNKKEREKKRQKKKKEKLERKAQRKLEKAEGIVKNPEFSYVDEFGNITSEPPDPTKKKEVIKAEDIIIGIPKKEHVEEEKTRTGRIKFFNHDKGFGFITDSMSQEDVFVHINNMTGQPQEGAKVSFETEMGMKGKSAIKVVII